MKIRGLPALERAVNNGLLSVRALLASLLLIFGLTGFRSPAMAANTLPAKEVLVLNSFSDSRLYDSLDALKASVRSQVRGPVNFQVEYLESQRFVDPGYEESLSEALGHVYFGKKLDVVIVESYPALQFALRHREQIFPGAPIVFSSVHAGRIQDQKLPRDVTGVTVTVDVRGSLELAFRLHPETKNVVLMTGTTEFERYWLGFFRKEFAPFEGQAKLIEIVGLPPDLLIQEMLKLPPHSVVFFQLSPRFSSQPVVGVYDALTIISQHVPTYCIFSGYCVDHGGIGGSYADVTEQNSKTASLVSRILSGERAENIPIVHDSGARPVVDWRQLRRWNISKSALPVGTSVLYLEPGPFERYWKFILGAVGLLVLQSLLIISLLRQRAKKRKIEKSLLASNRELEKSAVVLRESEERFRRVANTAPVLIWMSGADKLCTFFNQAWLDFTGRSMEEEVGNGWASRVHPEDLDRCFKVYSSAFDSRVEFEMEYRLQRFDKEYRWIVDYGVPRFESDGTFCGYIGSCIDITDRRLSEESLEELSGRLITAQEEERTRIARELHDDFSQRLALLGIGLGRLWKKLPESEAAERLLVQELLNRTKEISSDVHRLSHQLHSSKLEHVGLGPALMGLCEEISDKYGIEVELTDCGEAQEISRDMALCLFRIAQEALRNVVQHSQARKAQAELVATRSEVRLRIVDSGVGFDPALRGGGVGIGLVSMRERLRLVGGTLSIRSTPTRGTEVLAEVPFAASEDKVRAKPQAAGQ